MELIICICMMAVIIAVYASLKALGAAEDCEEENINLALNAKGLRDDFDIMSDEISRLTVEFDKLNDAYGKAIELIEATEDYTKEATNREKLMQDGINAIMGYDAMAAITNTGGDNG